MYIVHVVRQFHPSIGGIESVVKELATAQAVAGHRVRIVTLDRLFRAADKKALPARDIINGAEINRIPFFGSPRYPIAPSVLKFIRDADIVHVHAVDFFFDFLAWTKPLHRRKLVVSTHGGFFHTKYAARFKSIYFATITRLSLTWYDAVAAVSISDYELFARLRRRGLLCIENGADVGKYTGAAALRPTKSIVWIGRFSANKRLDRLVSFMSELCRRDRDWQLKIIGSPWDLTGSDLKGLVQNAGIAGAVKIFLTLSEAEIRTQLNDCSVLVSSSDFEGFGIAVAEGLSAGLFPVLSDIPAFHQMVAQAGTGLIVDFSRPVEAAEKFLTQWREIKPNYQRLRGALMAAAAPFDWRGASQAYMTLYDAIQGRRTRRILDVAVPVWTRSEVVEQLDYHFEQRRETKVAFANANCLNLAYVNPRLRIALSDALLLNDGIGIDLASRLLFGTQFPENLNGTDFTPYYLQNTRHHLRIFLLGGRPGIAERAGKVLAAMCPHHQIVGWRDGYFPRTEDGTVAETIRSTRADVVLVALGNPQQEIWLRDHLGATGCRLGFAVGALFDFMVGEAQRAPLWVRTLRVEWCYRLFREPLRLWRRYVIGNPLFMSRVLVQWWSGARV